MKPTTEVFMGYRNVGDSKDKGTTVPAAPLKEQLLVLIQYLGSVTMATRVQIVFGRNESDIQRGLDSERKTKSGGAMMDELNAALAAMGMSDSEIEEIDADNQTGWTPPNA